MIYADAAIKRVVAIHLDYDEDALEALQEIVSKESIRSGAVLSGIGTLSRCRYHAITTTGLPPKDGFYLKEGPIELVSANGVIADGKLHVHFMATDFLGQSFGGHLEPGCRTLYLCEFLIAEFAGLDLSFAIRPDTDLRQVAFKGGKEEPGPAVEFDAAGQAVVVGRAADWPHKPKRG